MTDILDVTTLDPTLPAPPQTVVYQPQADAVGHGRTLPLVGGSRNYVLDVLVDPLLLPAGQPQVRVYADNATGVLAVLVEGYATVAAEYEAALLAEDRDQVQTAFVDGFLYRRAHAHRTRIKLQQRFNEAAKADGTWDALDPDEQMQCDGGAAGKIPTGLIDVRTVDDPDGNPVDIDVPVWETDLITLVINRGDYDLYVDDNTPEPVSTMATEDPEGRRVVYVTRYPENLLVLDPTDDDLYMESLERAGMLKITVYDPQPVDQLFLDSVRLGQAIEAGQVTEGGTATFADLDTIYGDN